MQFVIVSQLMFIILIQPNAMPCIVKVKIFALVNKKLLNNLEIFILGPCKKGEILALPPKKSVPKCERNTCLDNMVRFRGRCSRLNENGGCPYHLKLQVNSNNLKIRFYKIRCL